MVGPCPDNWSDRPGRSCGPVVVPLVREEMMPKTNPRLSAAQADHCVTLWPAHTNCRAVGLHSMEPTWHRAIVAVVSLDSGIAAPRTGPAHWRSCLAEESR